MRFFSKNPTLDAQAPPERSEFQKQSHERLVKAIEEFKRANVGKDWDDLAREDEDDLPADDDGRTGD